MTVDGRPVGLVVHRRLAHPSAAARAACRSTRVELSAARAAVARRRPGRGCTTARSPAGSGWKAIVARPGRGHGGALDARRRGDPTDGLRAYPQDMLSSPLDERSATLSVAPRRRRPSSRRTAPGRSRRRRRSNRAGRRLRRRVRRRRRRATACCSCCCSPRSPGARCTRSPPATARRWSPPTSSARAAPRVTRSRSAPP